MLIGDRTLVCCIAADNEVLDVLGYERGVVGQQPEIATAPQTSLAHDAGLVGIARMVTTLLNVAGGLGDE